MTQVLILFGVFLLALMLHYFIVMEGFEGTTNSSTSGKTPFSGLVDTLTFYSVKPAQSTGVSTGTPTNTFGQNANQSTGAAIDNATIQRDVKLGPKDHANSSIAERAKMPTNADQVSAKVTNVLQQGKEYLQSGCKPKPIPGPTPGPTPGPKPCPTPCKCPEPKPVPFPCNSSDYIRKDQIPCWGCSLK